MIIKCNLEFNSSNQAGSLWISKTFLYNLFHRIIWIINFCESREKVREQIFYYQLCIVNYWNHSYQCCPTKQLTSVCVNTLLPQWNDPHYTAWIKKQYKQCYCYYIWMSFIHLCCENTDLNVSTNFKIQNTVLWNFVKDLQKW